MSTSTEPAPASTELALPGVQELDVSSLASFDDCVAAWRQVDAAQGRADSMAAWVHGDIAMRVTAACQSKAEIAAHLETFASAVGAAYGTVLARRTVSAAYGASSRRLDVAWSVYQALVGQPDRLELTAREEPWTAQEAKNLASARKAEAAARAQQAKTSPDEARRAARRQRDYARRTEKQRQRAAEFDAERKAERERAQAERDEAMREEGRRQERERAQAAPGDSAAGGAEAAQEPPAGKVVNWQAKANEARNDLKEERRLRSEDARSNSVHVQQLQQRIAELDGELAGLRDDNSKLQAACEQRGKWLGDLCQRAGIDASRQPGWHDVLLERLSAPAPAADVAELAWLRDRLTGIREAAERASSAQESEQYLTDEAYELIKLARS